MCEPVTAGLMIAGMVVSLVGQQQAASAAARQAAIRNQQFDFQRQVLENQQVAKAQEVVAEQEDQRTRLRLLGQAGAARRGDIRVAQAALGQLVDEGSALDITTALAGEVAFKKLLSTRESALRVRNLEIESQNIGADISILGLEQREAAIGASAQQTAAKIGMFSTVLSTGATLGSTFKIGKQGNLVFRKS